MKQPNSNIATLQETVVEKELGIWITNDLKPHDHVDAHGSTISGIW